MTEPGLFAPQESSDVDVQETVRKREKIEPGASFLQDHNGPFFRFAKAHSHMDIYVTEATALRLMTQVRDYFEKHNKEISNE